MNSSDLTRPALISGIALGVITAVPPFSVINLCTCCSRFAAAGFLSVHLLRKDSAVPLTPGNGALAGLASGLVGGLVHTIFSIPVSLLMRSLKPFNEGLMERVLEAIGDENHPLANLLRNYAEQGSEAMALFTFAWFVLFITQLVLTVFLFCLFAMLGGMLGVAILEKRRPQAVVPPVAPRGEEPRPPPLPPPPAPPGSGPAPG